MADSAMRVWQIPLWFIVYPLPRAWTPLTDTKRWDPGSRADRRRRRAMMATARRHRPSTVALTPGSALDQIAANRSMSGFAASGSAIPSVARACAMCSRCR